MRRLIDAENKVCVKHRKASAETQPRLHLCHQHSKHSNEANLKDIICNISALECVKMTRPLSYVVLSAVLTLFLMFPILPKAWCLYCGKVRKEVPEHFFLSHVD